MRTLVFIFTVSISFNQILFNHAQKCPFEWVEHDGFCYNVLDIPKSFYDGRKDCQKFGGDLASILNQTESRFITDFVLKGHGSSWITPFIGLNSLNDDKPSWIDGSEYNFNEFPSNNDNSPSEKCVQINFYGGNSKGWRTDNCGALNKPLCKARKGSKPIPTSPPSPPISGFCPTGWFGSADKCFKVVSLKQSLNWRDAKSVCNRFNISADLATISNARENLLVLSNIKEDERSNQFWFGAVRSRRRNSAYVWIDNSNIRPDDFNDFDNDINEHGSVSVPASNSVRTKSWIFQPPNSAVNGFICSTWKRNLQMLPASTDKNICKNGKYLGDGCQKIISNTSTWQEAVKRCKQKGMNLASIHSFSANAASNFLIYGKDDLYWIGMSSLTKKTFSWSDKSLVTYTNWKGGVIPDNNQKCVAMSSTGEWQTFECDLELPSICKSFPDPPLSEPDDVHGICPERSNWIPHGGHCYNFLSSRTSINSYAHGELRCKELGGRYASLLSIGDKSEQYWITSQIRKKLTQENTINFILGLQRVNNRFVWNDGTPFTYENWSENQPTLDKCTVMDVPKNSKSSWRSHTCDSLQHPFLGCKVKKIPYPPTPVPKKGKCPEKQHPSDIWEIYGKKCFLFGKFHLVSFFAANDDCAKVKGTLVEIDSRDENLFLFEKSKQHFDFFEDQAWIGFKKNGKNFQWLSGRNATYQNWFYRDPKSENCALLSMKHSGTWTSNNCLSSYAPYICQTDLIIDENKERLSVGSKVGIGMGVAIVVCVLVLTIAAVLYKRNVIFKEEAQRQKSYRKSSFESTISSTTA